MSYIQPEVVEKAREMDLLSYLQTYEPRELVHFGGSTYCTREHDSLKISNGKWYWFSRGIGGYSALDYLVKVKGMSFTEAVEVLVGQSAVQPPIRASTPEKEKTKIFKLPQANRSATHAVQYLRGRGIDREIIQYCIRTGRLYESYPHHNVVFVGMDKYGKPRYASLRGCGSDFVGEATGSDKRFSFSIPARDSNRVQLFESAIDLLSYATMEKAEGKDWAKDHLVSLAGVYKPKENMEESKVPMALTQYLEVHPEINQIVLRLDNDPTGVRAAETLKVLLVDRYEIQIKLSPSGKYYNDALCQKLGLPITGKRIKEKER